MSALSDPPAKWVLVTASDTTDLSGCRALRVEGAGNLVVRMKGAPDTNVTLSATSGEVIVGLFTRVMAATTATGIHAAY